MLLKLDWSHGCEAPLEMRVAGKDGTERWHCLLGSTGWEQESHDCLENHEQLWELLHSSESSL
jgi:hypothetical protein